MKLKRKVATVLAVTMVGSMLSACGSSSTTSTTTASSGGSTTTTKAASEDTGIYTEVGTYPVVKEGESVSISVFAPLRSSTSSYDASENLATAWLEEKTGVTFKFQTCLEVDAKQKLNTLMVGGDLPDVLMFSGNYPMTPSEQLLYGEQGDLIPLNDVIDQYMPNLKAMLEVSPSVVQSITMTDGNIYVLPQIGKTKHTYFSQKMWINQAWLDNLGLELPTTTEEYYEVLKAFKEQDANGNGNPNDEVPLSGSLSGWNNDPIVFLMNAFGPYYQSNDNKQGLYINDDGMVVYPKVTDEWKEGLKYLKKLYTEGLLDGLLFSQTQADLKKLGNNPETAILGSSTGGSIAAFMGLSDSDRWLDYTAVEPLEGPTGLKQAIYEPDTGKSGAAITVECEDVEAVARALDLFYEEEGLIWSRYGEMGVDIIEAQEGVEDFLGNQATYFRVTPSSEIGNQGWSQLGAWGMIQDYNLLFEAGDANIEYVLYRETVDKYEPYSSSLESAVLPMAMTEEDSRAIVDVEVPMEQYVSQATAEFITGSRDIDADWDAYVKAVESFGLATYLETYQKAVDARK